MFSTTPQSTTTIIITTEPAPTTQKFFLDGKISGAFHSHFISIHFCFAFVFGFVFHFVFWHRNFMVVVIFIVIHNDDIFGFSRSVSNKLNERKHIYCAFHSLYLCDDDEVEWNRRKAEMECQANRDKKGTTAHSSRTLLVSICVRKQKKKWTRSAGVGGRVKSFTGFFIYSSPHLLSNKEGLSTMKRLNDRASKTEWVNDWENRRPNNQSISILRMKIVNSHKTIANDKMPNDTKQIILKLCAAFTHCFFLVFFLLLCSTLCEGKVL